MNERFTRTPHHSDRNSARSPNAALLVDFDNVTMGMRSNLGQELRQLLNSDIIRGKVSVQRAYADWRRYPEYVVPLSEAAIDLIYAPAYGSSKKNATDIRLAIDALELVFTRPEIGSFILLSGDSDFSSLVLKLKEYGKYVIGVGMQESSSDLLVQNCDEYYSYDSLSGLVSAEEMETERHDPWELAEASIRKMVERNDVMRSDRLKQVMLELDPSFDEKEIGYSKFNRFLSEASSRGILDLKKIGNGQYKVGPGSSVEVEATAAGDGGDGASPGGGASAAGRKRREAPEPEEEEPAGRPGRGKPSGGGGESGGSRGSGAGRRGGRSAGGPVVEARQLREAYDLLQEVVSDLSEDGGAVRDSEVKREMLNRDSSFDEAALGFSKFSRFIRQAHDEEVLDVTKDSDGNYYLALPGGEAGAAPEGGPSGRQDEEPEPPSAPGSPGAGAEGAESGPDAGDGGGPAPEEEPTATGGRDEDASSGKPTGGARTGLRRRGRGGKKAGESSSDSDGSWVPGPVDAGGSGDRDGGSTAKGGGAAGGTDSGAEGSGRRGLGRFRRGRKSKKGDGGAGGGEKAPAPGPVDEGGDSGSGGASDAGSDAEGAAGPGAGAADAERPAPGSGTGPDPSPSARAGEADGIVEHMTDHYSGVGVKTARKLVEEFGERTLEVIDQEPERVEKLLPKHRAEAVLQARAGERERGGAAADRG